MLTPQSAFAYRGVRYLHRECLADFAGNGRDPAHWVDLFVSEAGDRLLRCGGNWRHYGAAPPVLRPDDAPSFLPFLAACQAGEEIAAARLLFAVAR